MATLGGDWVAMAVQEAICLHTVLRLGTPVTATAAAPGELLLSPINGIGMLLGRFGVEMLLWAGPKDL